MIKTKVDGNVDHYKARVAAKGFTQEYESGYEETFAPIARLISICSFLIVVAIKH